MGRRGKARRAILLVAVAAGATSTAGVETAAAEHAWTFDGSISAELDVSPNPARVNRVVTFDGSESHENTGLLCMGGGGGLPSDFYWDLDGDKVYELHTIDDPVVTRVYTFERTIEVTLKVSGCGGTDTATETLIVNESAALANEALFGASDAVVPADLVENPDASPASPAAPVVAPSPTGGVDPNDDVTTDAAPATAVDADLFNPVQTGDITVEEAMARTDDPVACQSSMAYRVTPSLSLPDHFVRFSGQLRCDGPLSQTGRARLRTLDHAIRAIGEPYDTVTNLGRSRGQYAARRRVTYQIVYDSTAELAPGMVWAEVPAECTGTGTGFMACTRVSAEFR
jgi:hypothetical protein